MRGQVLQGPKAQGDHVGARDAVGLGRDVHHPDADAALVPTYWYRCVLLEHPVTEMITGIDLVREQIRIAAGGRSAITQDDIRFTGHAIECRINAENPDTFVPSPGRIVDYHAPGGPGVRVDSALYAGYRCRRITTA